MQLLNVQLIVRPHAWLRRSHQVPAQVGYGSLVNAWGDLLSRTATVTIDRCLLIYFGFIMSVS